MADIVDIANDHIELTLRERLAAAPKELEPGVPGECEWCGEYFTRIVRGACGRCRDERKLP